MWSAEAPKSYRERQNDGSSNSRKLLSPLPRKKQIVQEYSLGVRKKSVGGHFVPCKYKGDGCSVMLTGKEIIKHNRLCDYKPIRCRICTELIPFGKFAEHLRRIEKVIIFKSPGCRSRFEIWGDGGNEEPWTPIWIHYENTDFFCFLERSTDQWWLWVGASAPTEVCQNFVASITIWSEENCVLRTFVGSVLHVGTLPKAALRSSQCLRFRNINPFLRNGGIDILLSVRSKKDHRIEI